MSKISELSDGGSLVSTDYLIVVRSGGNVKVKMDTINVDQVDLGDNEFIRLGNSQDLTLVHTSTQSIINQAGVGDLLLQKAGTTKASITANGLEFPDNSKAIFGDNDLQIYHNGSNSFIDDAGTGNLQIRGTQIKLQKYTGENMFVGISDGAASMYYDNSQKIATTATGIDVTGGITATDGSTITVTDNTDVLTLISTDADENSGPRLALTRNSASPADNDYVGLIAFNGENSADESIRMGMIRAQVLDVTDGTEDSTLTFYSRHGGAEVQRIATTATGIDVTGTVTADGLSVSTATGTASPNPTTAYISTESSGSDWSASSPWGRLAFYSADGSGGGGKPHVVLDATASNGIGASSSFSVSTTSESANTLTKRLNIARNGDISFYNTAGTSQSLFWDASAESLGLGVTLPTGILSISGADTTTKPQIRFMTGAATNLADAAISTTDDSGGTSLLIGSNQYYSGGSISRFTTSRSGSAINFGYTGTMKFYTGSGTAAPSEAMRIDSEGRVTKPYQPAFLELLSADQANIPNTGAATTITFNTEVYDVGGNFSTTTHTFTAPVTGKYQLNVSLLLGKLDIAAAYYQVQLTTSNRIFYNTFDPRGLSQDLNYWEMPVTVIADMDANDTAIVKIVQSGGTTQTDVINTAVFSGFLAC